MTEVLVLGNGISRLAWHELILEWPGEVWGCNRVYREYGALLSRLTGHKEVLIEAIEEMKQHEDWKFRVWGGHLGSPLECAEPFTCSKKYQNDSGTTLVAQALHEGKTVAVCGFDLGGPDIHSPGLEHVAKWNWVDRWRALFREYGHDRVRFIGHDHKPFILSRHPSTAYARYYLNGNPHIPDDDYLVVWEEWAGRPAKEVPEGLTIMRVRFKNGRESEIKDVVAKKMIAKGKATAVKAKAGRKPKEEKAEEKAEE